MPTFGGCKVVTFKSHAVALFASWMLSWAPQAAAQIPTYNLFNDTTAELFFQTLDPARGTWKDQSLKAHEQKTYNMTSGDPVGKIRIATPSRGYNEYKVGAGGVYRLTWSDPKQMWDVRTVQQGHGAQTNPVQPLAANSNPAATAQAPVRTAALPYRLGDSVLALWKQSWYAATVIQMNGSKLKIHYDGYGNDWDEWVDGSRVRPR